MCEIRFNISAKDGKLEGMMNSIPSGIRTEVVKEALRYFLCNVRDKKVESDYINADLLQEFKTDVQQDVFSLQDMFKLLELRQMQQPMQVVGTAQAPVHIVEQSIKEDLIDVNMDKEENENEFDLDLSVNEFDNQISSIEVDVDFNEFNF